jgi:tetratricopeptide (TPR) repeat protein
MQMKTLPFILVLIVFVASSCFNHSVSDEVKNINVTRLDLSFRELDSIPHGIGKLTKLKTLDLSGNRIAVLPPEIWQLPNLISLNLGWNKLKNIPSEISGLTSLEELVISGNQLDSLPKALGNLPNLRKLEISWNNIPGLPPELANLKNLRELKLYDNPFRDEDSTRALFPGINLVFDFVLPTEANLYYYKKGLRLQRLNRPGSAMKYYDLALQYDPEYIYAYRNRGVIRFNAGDKAGGCVDWQRAAELGDTISRAMFNKYCR